MLDINLCGMKLKNPLVLASGIVGVSRASIKYAVDNGAGAATIKSLTADRRKGHPAPIITTFEGGMLNSVGYSNPGIDNIGDEFDDLSTVGAPVLGSITGRDADEFAMLAEKADKMDFDAIEIVLSCPHTPGYGTMAGQSTPEITAEITRKVRAATKKPLFVKLSPNVMGLVELAKAAEAAGADGITAINTAGPGMVIDIKSKKPVLGGTIGGLSGEALKPIAVRCVYEIYQAVKIPIIGTGGVSTGRDAIEMLLAGASAVGVGSSVYNRGIDVFNKINEEMKEIMKEEGYTSIKEIIGKAHDN